jgi:Flp pilus assembly protein TadG
VGDPVDVSVNVTVWPTFGEAGLKVNEAASVGEVTTVTIWVVLFDDEALLAVKVTAYVPFEAKLWLGFWELEVPPSLKFQDQAVGVPIDVSVNWTACPAAGEAGVNVNDATTATATVTVRVVLADPVPFVAVRVTVFDPAVAKEWLGFCEVEVAPSPKFQDQAVGVPVDVSVNWTACPATGEAGVNVNEAASAAATVTVRVVLADPVPLVTVSVTVFDPAVV